MAHTRPKVSSVADADPGRLMTEREAAARLGYTDRALQNWRLRGGGPVYVKVSNRSIRYRPQDLDAWVEAGLRVSTADPGHPPSHSSAEREGAITSRRR